MSKLDQLGEYEKQAVRTVERQGFSVAEKAPEVPGCWVAWHWDESYRQRALRVFGTEVEALRWALSEGAGHKVTFVRWGQSPEEAEDA